MPYIPPFKPSGRGISSDMNTLTKRSMVVWAGWKSKLKSLLEDPALSIGFPHKIGNEKVLPLFWAQWMPMLSESWGGGSSPHAAFLKHLGFTEENLLDIDVAVVKGQVRRIETSWSFPIQFDEATFAYLVDAIKEVCSDIGLDKVIINTEYIAYKEDNYPLPADRPKYDSSELKLRPMEKDYLFLATGAEGTSRGPIEQFTINDEPIVYINREAVINYADVRLINASGVDITDTIDDDGVLVRTLAAITMCNITDGTMDFVSSVKTGEREINTDNKYIAVTNEETYDYAITSSFDKEYERWVPATFGNDKPTMIAESFNDDNDFISSNIKNSGTENYIEAVASHFWTFRDTYVNTLPYEDYLFNVPGSDITNTHAPFVEAEGYLYLREDWFDHADEADILFVFSKCIKIQPVQEDKDGSFLGVGGFVGKFLGGMMATIGTLINEIFDIWFNLPVVKQLIRLEAWIWSQVTGMDIDKMIEWVQILHKTVVMLVVSYFIGPEAFMSVMFITIPVTIYSLVVSFDSLGDNPDSPYGKKKLEEEELLTAFDEANEKAEAEALNASEGQTIGDIESFEETNKLMYSDMFNKFDPMESISNPFDKGGMYDIQYKI